MRPLLIQGGRIVDPSQGIDDISNLLITDGKISWLDRRERVTTDAEYDVLNAGGLVVCPGFIDLHNQGGGGYTVMNGSGESIRGIARTHAAHGTTGFLVTPLIEKDSYRSLLPKLAGMVGKKTGGATVLGIHAEGPFVNPERKGCMPLNAICVPNRVVLDDILEAGSGKIVEMTIAPELPGALDLILTLTHEKIVASLGHSNAVLADVFFLQSRKIFIASPILPGVIVAREIPTICIKAALLNLSWHA